MSSDEDWIMVDEIRLGSTWEVVGPFPSGMREHPLTGSPLAAFPRQPDVKRKGKGGVDPDIDFARRPYGENETFPSAMGTGGRVGWQRYTADDDGHIRITYPDIEWDDLRRDHGWAALQHQCLLRTDLVVPPVQGEDEEVSLRVELTQGTEFAFVGEDQQEADGSTVKWYHGDVYDFASTPSGSRQIDEGQTSNFARSIALRPGRYVVLVRAMYEIRMFGDPGLGKPPTIDTCFRIALDDADGRVEVVAGLRVVPDVVDGWLMGDWISVPIRVPASATTGLSVTKVNGTTDGTAIQLQLAGGEVSVAPGQTRPIALRSKQHERLKKHQTTLRVVFTVEREGHESKLEWQHHLVQRESANSEPFLITFASPHESADEVGDPALISYASVVPPSLPLESGARLPPVLLGLHGAGVDVETPFWAAALPAVPGMWSVLPTGKNEWGEDWHGGSMEDVWAARAVLPRLVARIGASISGDTLLVGHSNGGQGAWHLAARYPDRVVGVIAASGWLKIQDYVPYLHLTSSHYADPILMGILQSALTPYNNDLYASNLAHLPVLAVHGADDDNVPPRHSRQHVALIQAWQGDCSQRKLVEVPAKGHWWDDVLKQPEVYDFIASLPAGRRDWEADRKRGFTLTTANPDVSGSRSGIQIVELRQRGRLGRLDVGVIERDGQEQLDLQATNVKRISFQAHPGEQVVPMALSPSSTTESSETRRYGPVIRLLATSGPITIIVDPAWTSGMSVATRYAHDLFVYHRLAVNIISDTAAIAQLDQGGLRGNLVILGRDDQNNSLREIRKRDTLAELPVAFHHDSIALGGRRIADAGTGLVSLLPHPSQRSGLAVLIAGLNDEGLELAARLLPLRTGVPVPDWAIVSPRTRWQAAGGMIGAGWYDHAWRFSEGMSWMDRIDRVEST